MAICKPFLMPIVLVKVWCCATFLIDAKSLLPQDLPTRLPRGGASSKVKQSDDAFGLLALAIQNRLDVEEEVDLSRLQKTLSSLSSAQQALKGLDGVAHEAYQRTHHLESSLDTSVSGRAKRSAERAGCTADALFAAELCELLEKSDELLSREQNENGTLVDRQVVLNATTIVMTKTSNVTVLVLYEPLYSGGAGMSHGGIEDLAGDDFASSTKRGRLLIVIGDSCLQDLPKTLDILDVPPLEVGLHTGLVANEIASVQGTLYRTAGRVLKAIEPTIRMYKNTTAIHFVGQSLAGGVASLSSLVLDGSLPLPRDSADKRKRQKHGQQVSSESTAEESLAKTETQVLVDGLGRGRTSAVILGAPPCLSANVKAAFCKSIIYGDDVICRSSKESLDRLCSRASRALKSGILGRQVGWMTDAISLTVSSLKTHAHGSEGEEARLVVPGQAFLVRPRRLGGTCSIHEVGSHKGGREALRAAVFWQLQDVLLSKSLWKHHQLESYIQGLARVQLRGFDSIDIDESYY